MVVTASGFATCAVRQHRLYFLPLPHGQASLRPILAMVPGPRILSSRWMRKLMAKLAPSLSPGSFSARSAGARSTSAEPIHTWASSRKTVCAACVELHVAVAARSAQWSQGDCATASYAPPLHGGVRGPQRGRPRAGGPSSGGARGGRVPPLPLRLSARVDVAGAPRAVARSIPCNGLRMSGVVVRAGTSW